MARRIVQSKATVSYNSATDEATEDLWVAVSKGEIIAWGLNPAQARRMLEYTYYDAAEWDYDRLMNAPIVRVHMGRRIDRFRIPGFLSLSRGRRIIREVFDPKR